MDVVVSKAGVGTDSSPLVITSYNNEIGGHWGERILYAIITKTLVPAVA